MITNEDYEKARKSMTKLAPEEREVVLVMDDRDRKWKASCSSPTYMKKFEKQGWKCTDTTYYPNGEVMTKFYEAPSASSISIGKAERPKRKLTEDQRQKLSERMKRVASKNK